MNSTVILTPRKLSFGVGQRLTFLRKWKARMDNRRALRHEFRGASPTWMAHIERDIGLEPGTLQAEMNKPFWAE